jgi:hypothetical protein
MAFLTAYVPSKENAYNAYNAYNKKTDEEMRR